MPRAATRRGLSVSSTWGFVSGQGEETVNTQTTSMGFQGLIQGTS